MKIQGRADRDVRESGKREPRSYSVNQNFPSQIGTAIDPMAAERFHEGNTLKPPYGVTDGMGQGPGANRDGGTPGSPISKCGSQGCR